MKNTTICATTLQLMMGLAFWGCSNAVTCEEGEGCAPYGNRGVAATEPQDMNAEQMDEENPYTAVLAAECAQLCSALDICGRKIFSDESRTCSSQCEEQQSRERYFNCEPLFRRYMACVTDVGDCQIDDCLSRIEGYVACMDPVEDLPPSANSCVLANNGVCDEPDECLVGSDTNDCDG